MASHPEARTSVTLLGRLHRTPGDGAAWAEFDDRYRPVLRAWCLRWGLQEADVEDVTQAVLAKMVILMPNFQYDRERSFRGLLRTLARHALSELNEADRRSGRGRGDSHVAEQARAVEAGDDLYGMLAAEHERDVLDAALKNVQARVHPRTWEAFRLMALEERPGAEVAARLGMTVVAVYQARYRIMEKVREEYAALDGQPLPS